MRILTSRMPTRTCLSRYGQRAIFIPDILRLKRGFMMTGSLILPLFCKQNCQQWSHHFKYFLTLNFISLYLEEIRTTNTLQLKKVHANFGIQNRPSSRYCYFILFYLLLCQFFFSSANYLLFSSNFSINLRKIGIKASDFQHKLMLHISLKRSSTGS